MPTYQLYTDGSCYQGIGAWAYAVVDTETRKLVREDSGAFNEATNNRAELLAVIRGLEAFKPSTPLEVVSDSAYVVNCFNDKWYQTWFAQHWIGSSGPVKNRDLWERLFQLAFTRHTAPILWTHVRGHQGNQWNEHVDKLCSIARKSAKY